jgi:chromosome segregation ATPase
VAELAAGGGAMLQRLAEIGAANQGLRQQLEMQVNEVTAMEESHRLQQQRIVQYEKQAEQMRQEAAAAAEARVRAETSSMEARLIAQIEATRNDGKTEREELLQRLQRAEDDRSRLESEADEARKQASSALSVASLQAEQLRQQAAKASPPASPVASNVVNDTRAKSLEMELNLLRQRLAREVEGRQVAERACNEAKSEQQRMKADLEKNTAESLRLRRFLTEQADIASFRQEQCNDLQLKLKAQKEEMEHRVRNEKEKFQAVNRLEGLLPKHMLIQALC